MDRHIFTVAPQLSDLLPQGVQVPPNATLAALSAGPQQWPGRDNSTKSLPGVTFYKGSLDDAAALSAWIEMNRFPGIWSIDETNFYEFTHASRRTALVAVDPSDVSKEVESAVRNAANKLKDDVLFGILDGINLADELSDFNLYKRDLPRVLVTEDDLAVWVEDIEQLRVTSLEEDLRNFIDGAPLLRRDRGAMSKLKLYKREAYRFSLRLRAYAATGVLQTVLVCSLILLSVVVVLAICWCIFSCCRILLIDDFDPPMPTPAERAAQRMATKKHE